MGPEVLIIVAGLVELSALVLRMMNATPEEKQELLATARAKMVALTGELETLGAEAEAFLASRSRPS